MNIGLSRFGLFGNLTLAFMVVGLSGCATLTDAYKADPTIVPIQAMVPEVQNLRWSEPAPDDQPKTNWVGGFFDDQLVVLVNEALAANPDVLAARARYEAAVSRVDISNADRLPIVGASGQISRTENANSFNPDRTGLSIGADISWETDLWGRIRDQIGSSEKEAEASLADLAGARLSIAGQVVQNWFNLIEARQFVELSGLDVENQERALRLTMRRFEGGISGSSDVRLARSALANATALAATREQNLASFARRLEILLRRYPANEIQAGADLPVLPPLTGAGVPSDLLRRRPDLIAAERRLDAAGLNVDVAKKNLLPRLNLTGSTNAAGSGLSSFFDVDALIANVAAGLTAPIFQGGRLKANIAQQEAFLRQQLELYAGSALTAYLEVEDALTAERLLEEREAALEISLEESIQAEARLERRYSEGLATILQLLDSQSRRISAASQLISARKERLANRVRLHLALGGGELGQPPVLSAQAEDTDILKRIFKR